MPFKSYHRGVFDLKIASWTAENSYGTAVDVPGIRQANLSWVVESDELRGDDVRLAYDAKIVGAALSIAQAAVELAVLDMILGGTFISNAQYYDHKVAEGSQVPYVCIAGRVKGSGGVGDLQFMLPKAMVAGNLAFNAALDSWLIPSADFQGVNEGTINGIVRIRQFLQPTALTIPLATTGGGG